MGPVRRALSGAAFLPPWVASPPSPLWRAREGSGLWSYAKVGQDVQ